MFYKNFDASTTLMESKVDLPKKVDIGSIDDLHAENAEVFRILFNIIYSDVLLYELMKLYKKYNDLKIRNTQVLSTLKNQEQLEKQVKEFESKQKIWKNSQEMQTVQIKALFDQIEIFRVG